MDYEAITRQAEKAMTELLDIARPEPGDLVVVGCSSSEVLGSHIGKGSSPEAAAAVLAGLAPVVKVRGLYLVAQCCEHLNRALILEKEAARKFGYEIVNVVPQPKAGGSFATALWAHLNEPVAVEQVRASCGLDIGGTLIGMHLRPVAVPVRLSLDHIGEALLLCARTRPKYIGGSRAVYAEE
ncbi:MAG: TIGR01440 family protein [Clostridia bacterium]|nr:TIGR01440 family protein [Clostridia bacterium]